MTPEEAIKELTDSLDESIPSLRERRREATNLGIEALRHIQNERAIGGFGHEVSLPGLTED